MGTGFLELEGDPIGSAFRLQGDLVGTHRLGEVQFLQNGQAGRGAAQIGGFQGIEVFRPSLSQIGGQGGLKSAPPGVLEEGFREDRLLLRGRIAIVVEADQNRGPGLPKKETKLGPRWRW